eukprot:1152462-Pelagomonas_calceolata.AAC.5
MLDDVTHLMCSAHLPGLFKQEEQQAIIKSLKPVARAAGVQWSETDRTGARCGVVWRASRVYMHAHVSECVRGCVLSMFYFLWTYGCAESEGRRRLVQSSILHLLFPNSWAACGCMPSALHSGKDCLPEWISTGPYLLWTQEKSSDSTSFGFACLCGYSHIRSDNVLQEFFVDRCRANLHVLLLLESNDAALQTAKVLEMAKLKRDADCKSGRMHWGKCSDITGTGMPGHIYTGMMDWHTGIIWDGHARTQLEVVSVHERVPLNAVAYLDLWRICCLHSGSSWGTIVLMSVTCDSRCTSHCKGGSNLLLQELKTL